MPVGKTLHPSDHIALQLLCALQSSGLHPGLTGGTAIGYIHGFVIDQAKNLLMKGLSVGEVADLLGFEYPHHFSRLFKKVTGSTPSEFLK